MGLNPVTRVLVRDAKSRQRKGTCDYRGRDWRDVATAKGGLDPRSRRRQAASSPRASGGNSAPGTFVPSFRTSMLCAECLWL